MWSKKRIRSQSCSPCCFNRHYELDLKLDNAQVYCEYVRTVYVRLARARPIIHESTTPTWTWTWGGGGGGGGGIPGEIPVTLATRMEAVPVVAVRVVRGPDWCWEEQDGGEGGVGTVVAVTDEGQSAEVQWDCGIRACYRCGREGKFDLRAFDTAPTGTHAGACMDVHCEWHGRHWAGVL